MSFTENDEAVELLPANGISVLVVGSGIGGLSAARELWRIGCDVRVLEKRSGEVTTGDSFMIGPSAISTLLKFPSLMRDVKAIGQFPDIYVHRHDGTLVRSPMRATEMLSESARAVLPAGTAPQETSRPKMYAAMLAQLQRVGVAVERGAEAVSYFDAGDGAPGGRAGVVLKDGTRREADLVVAADGVHSVSTKLVLGHHVPAKPSGHAAFRVAYPIERVAGNAIIEEGFPADKAPMICTYLGGPDDIQVYVFRFQHDIAWFCMHEDDGRAAESWDSHPSLSVVLDLLATHPELPPAVLEVVRLTPPNSIVDFRIMLRDPQPTWTSRSGRIIQLGDAAHTFHPNSGNGATQAIEDAATLAACVALSGLRVPWATRVCNLLRFERVSCIQAFGIYSQSLRRKGQRIPPFSRWIVAHDAEAYARERFAEALDHLQKGTPFRNTNTPPGMEYRPWSINTLMDEKERGEPTVLDGDWS